MLLFSAFYWPGYAAQKLPESQWERERLKPYRPDPALPASPDKTLQSHEQPRHSQPDHRHHGLSYPQCKSLHSAQYGPSAARSGFEAHDKTHVW